MLLPSLGNVNVIVAFIWPIYYYMECKILRGLMYGKKFEIFVFLSFIKFMIRHKKL